MFSLDTFLEAADHPRFLRYLIGSRRPDAVLIASSREAYRYLPYLRAQFPDLPILDYLHFVTPDWMDGGIPRLSTLYQPFLDLTGVSSGHVKEWMVARGADGSRILGCHLGVDTHFWRPDLDCRARVREQLGLDEETALISTSAGWRRRSSRTCSPPPCSGWPRWSCPSWRWRWATAPGGAGWKSSSPGTGWASRSA